MSVEAVDKMLAMIEHLIQELDDAVDFMGTFEGYEDDDAIERRERKVQLVEDAGKIVFEWKQKYSNKME